MCINQPRQESNVAKIAQLRIGMARSQMFTCTDIEYSSIADENRPRDNDRPDHRRDPGGAEKFTAGLP
jgi:hypothetical protein